ncbi:MAG TPA: endonuclease III [Anaerolineae bacterium]|nr:endonuclease III [Caldilineae bacterium]HID33211.1 endonuclease III [Anaerolineae bacterium]HIQ12109.1 endonuclease III [Caldilineales bacterium]
MTNASAPRPTLTPDDPPEARIHEILRRLRIAHPDAHCELVHDDPWQLLVATILSAQCTDERVNSVTPILFERFPTPRAMADADRAEIEAIIRPTGFYRNKARFIQEAAQRIAYEYDGAIPPDMGRLLQLPGVARKTANVVLGVGFNIADGVVVDTHVKRIANRLGLTQHQDPKKIERDLMTLVPRQDWIDVSHLMIFHGRRVCKARKPDCAHCILNDLCPSAIHAS